MRLLFWPSLRYARPRANGSRTTIASIGTTFQIINLLSAIVVLMVSPATLAASNTSIEGIITDDVSGLPVIAATVIVQNTDYAVFADNSGRFNFQNIPPGRYGIIISSVGYKIRHIKNVEVIPDMSTRLDIELERLVQALPPLKVRSKRIKVADVGATVIDRRAIEKSHAKSLAGLLADIDGLQIEKSGAKQEVKIRGSASDDVLILVDGQRFNGPADGKADLSGIPLEMVERIEIIKGGASAVYGPDALSGAINIITQSSDLAKTSQVMFGREWGSWKAETYKAGLENDLISGKLSTRLFWTGSQAPHAFPYYYSVQPENKVYRGIRNNNGYNKYNYYLSGQYMFDDARSIRFSGHLYRNRYGLPGAASQPSLTANATDRRVMGTVMLDIGKDDRNAMRLTAGFTRLEQSFVEPDKSLPPAVRFDNKYINDIYNFDFYRKFALPGQLETQAGSQVRYESLDHNDNYTPRFSMNRSTRNDLGLYLSASRTVALSIRNTLEFLSVSGTMRYDISHTNKDSTSVRDTVTSNGTDYLSPRFTLALGKSGGLAYTLSGSWGRSLKIPPINALFWQGDALSGGNPGLKPEKSEQFEIGLRMEYEYEILSLSGGLTWFETRIEDIIVWMPLYGGWRPVNRNSAKITGHDDFIHIGLFEDHIEFDFKNTTTSPLNKTPGHNSYNNDLPFSPRYVTSYAITFDYDNIYGSYTIRQSGRAFTNEATTKYYDAYRIHIVRLGGKYEVKKNWMLNLDLSFDNIKDDNYVLIAHYPMPGYSWGISCGIKYAP